MALPGYDSWLTRGYEQQCAESDAFNEWREQSAFCERDYWAEIKAGELDADFADFILDALKPATLRLIALYVAQDKPQAVHEMMRAVIRKAIVMAEDYDTDAAELAWDQVKRNERRKA